MWRMSTAFNKGEERCIQLWVQFVTQASRVREQLAGQPLRKTQEQRCVVGQIEAASRTECEHTLSVAVVETRRDANGDDVTC